MAKPIGNKEYQVIGPGSHDKVMGTLNEWADADILRGVVSMYFDGDRIGILVKVNRNNASNFQS